MADPVVLQRGQRDALLKVAARYVHIFGPDEELTSRQWQAIRDVLEENGMSTASLPNRPMEER